jgi:hypothetical protein
MNLTTPLVLNALAWLLLLAMLADAVVGRRRGRVSLAVRLRLRRASSDVRLILLAALIMLAGELVALIINDGRRQAFPQSADVAWSFSAAGLVVLAAGLWKIRSGR